MSLVTVSLPRPAWMDLPALVRLCAVMRQEQVALRAVGGAVRDSVLGREVHEVDLCSPVPPEAMMALCERAGLRVIPTGLQHGTVTVMCEGASFEITTLRKDVACDGRHAQVAFTDDWEEDALRRDLTMNALSVDVLAQGDAVTLYDYTQGYGDALAGRVRFIGDTAQRIQEDYLRILRFFRFYASHGAEPIDADALQACIAQAQGLAQISGERIQDEMFKLLCASHAARSLCAMSGGELFPVIFGCRADGAALDAASTALKELASHRSHVPLAVYRVMCLAVWQRMALRGVDVMWVSERWRLSRKDAALLAVLCDAPVTVWDATRVKMLREQISGELVMAQYVVTCVVQAQPCDTDLLALIAQWQVPDFPVSGHEVMVQCGVSGKEVGVLLEQLRVQWRASDYMATKESLLNFLSHHHPLS